MTGWLKWTVRALAIAVVAVGAGRGAAAADLAALQLLDAPVSYAADFYVRSDKGDYTGTVLHAPGRERRDFVTQTGSQALLLRRDTNLAYMLMPPRKWYVGMSFDAVSEMVGGVDRLMVHQRRIGPDAIDGQPATHFEVSAANADGGRFNGDMWQTHDGVVVRLAGTVLFQGRETSIDTGLRNLKRGAQPGAAFDLPADYKGLSMAGLSGQQVGQTVKALKGAQ